MEWDAAILNERENELLTWRSFSGSDVDTAGSVRFRALAGGQSTELTVDLHFSPPGGMMGRSWARLLGDTLRQQIHEDLWRFKQAAEQGTLAAIAQRPAEEHPPLNITPSQAEGSRNVIQEDLCEKKLAAEEECQKLEERQENPVIELPSQAEGDRRTIDEDLWRRGMEGRR